MSNELVPAEAVEATPPALPDIAALQQASDYSDKKGFVDVAGPGFGTFLPYLQLFTSNSEECKTGEVPVAHYGTVEGKEKTITVIGKTVRCCPIAWRAKAMFFKTADGKPVAFHNQKSKEFLDIRAAADADSNSGNMYGPEFLMWLPDQKKYVTFFMGSKTARNAATPVHALLPRSGGGLKCGVLAAQFIQGTEYSWHGPTISPSDQSFEGPDFAEIAKIVSDFLTPKDSVIAEAAPIGSANPDR